MDLCFHKFSIPQILRFLNPWFHGFLVPEILERADSWIHNFKAILVPETPDSMDRLRRRFLIPEILGLTELWLTYPLIYAALVSRDQISLWIFDTIDPYFRQSTCIRKCLILEIIHTRLCISKRKRNYHKRSDKEKDSLFRYLIHALLVISSEIPSLIDAVRASLYKRVFVPFL